MTPSDAGKLGAAAYKITAARIKQEKIDSYKISPSLCKQCNNELSFEKRMRSYCSHSCSGIATGAAKSKTIRSTTWSCLNCNKMHSWAACRVGTYCNVRCQHEYMYNQRIAEWKLTGKIDTVSAPAWLKRYILDKQGNKCAGPGCVVTTLWNGRPIVLDLEHIDGNSQNNIEANLCCLCPNCHSQTSTYKAKNKGNKGNGRHSRRERYNEGKSF